MKVEQWPIKRLIPYAGNPRKNDHAVDSMARAIQEFGFRIPIIAKSDGTIVDGHLRYKAAQKLGLTKVPVMLADDMTEAQIKAFRIAVNQAANWAEWDTGLLAMELGEIKLMGFDLNLLGFDDMQLVQFMATPGGLEGADPEEVPEPPVNPVTRAGDLWLLGNHRLLAGDATKAADVKRLLGEARPHLMVTDPPYGVELDMEWRDRRGHNELAPASRSYMKIAMAGKGISGDTRPDWSEAYELVPSISIVYVWHASLHTIEVGLGLERIGFDLRHQIIWAKTVAAMSRSAYQWKHEPCWYAVCAGSTAEWVGGHDQTTVWEAASPKHIMSGSKEEKYDHPTQKPIALYERAIANHGAIGDWVYEPFSGSGTALVACERLSRCCAAIEVEPRFVDVALERWEKFTGKKATLESSGRTFAEVRAERAPRSRTKKGAPKGAHSSKPRPSSAV